MRILLINSVCGTGSTGKIIADIVNLLKKSGHEAKALYGVGEAKGVIPQDAVKTANQLDYYLHNGLSRITDHAGLYSRKATYRLIQEIKIYGPDLIHLHTLHGYYINYEILFEFLKKANIPVAWTLHDCWPFTGHCTNYSAVGCRQWQDKCIDCPQLHRYPKCWFTGDVEKNFIRKKTAFTGLQNLVITAPSHWLADQISASFLKDYPVQVIPNGIDRSIFHPQGGDLRERYGLQGKKIVLGVANVWSKSKGTDDMILLSRMLDDAYQIVMIGLTSKQMEDLPKEIIGIQRTKNQQALAQWYSEADVFVNPTYEETFGLTTVEAQACGTPVVVYETGACPETVTYGNGTIVPQGNLEKLKEAVVNVVCAGKHADSFAIKLFDKELVYQEYFHLYARIIQGEHK